MNIFEKVWKDKNKRNLILVLALIVFILSVSSPKNVQTQATMTMEQCNSLVNPLPGGLGLTTTDYTVCTSTSGCYALFAPSMGDWVLGVDDITTCLLKAFMVSPAQDCVNQGKQGQKISSALKSACETGYSKEVATMCGTKIYECYENPNPETCTAMQTKMRDMVNSFWKDADCTTSMFVVIGGGVLFMVLILAIL